MKMKYIISTDGGVSNGQDPFTSINSTLLLSLEQGLVRTIPECPFFSTILEKLQAMHDMRPDVCFPFIMVYASGSLYFIAFCYQDRVIVVPLFLR